MIFPASVVIAVILLASVGAAFAGMLVGRLSTAGIHAKVIYRVFLAGSFLPIVGHAWWVTGHLERLASKVGHPPGLGTAIDAFEARSVLLTLFFVAVSEIVATKFAAHLSIAPLLGAVVYHFTALGTLAEDLGAWSPIRSHSSLWLFVLTGACSLFLVSFITTRRNVDGGGIRPSSGSD